MSVNTWLTCHQQDVLQALKTKPGQGRKAMLHKDTDAKWVRQPVQQERQRLSQAKSQLEQQLDRPMSLLQRFLKNLTVLPTYPNKAESQTRQGFISGSL